MIHIPPTDGHVPADATTPAPSPSYEIIVDRDLCIGAATCVDLARKTFALDSEQRAVVLEGERDEDAAILAAAKSCPTLAIILRDRATGTQVWPA